MTTVFAPTNGAGLPAPLRVRPDMTSRWTNLDVDFDVAAHAIVTEHANDGEAVDLPLLDLRTWGVISSGGAFALAPLAKNHTPKLLRANAFANLATKLNVPADFLRDRLPAPLQLATLNYLLASAEKSQPATLRLRGDEVAALVSERYAPFEQEALLSCVRDALIAQDALEAVEVRSIATGMVDVLRLVFPAEAKPVKVNDISSIGIDISTSSFGKSAIHVRGLVWRLKCTNGLRVSEGMGSYSFRHVGDVDRLRASVAEAIPTALTLARGTFARWQQAVVTMVTDVERMIADMRDLTTGEREMVATELKRETGMSALPEHTDLYSFLNGLTAAAQHVSPSRRLELESLAGDLLYTRTS